MVMLRKFDKDGFLFLTSYSSRKAEDMDSNPCAAATFYWHPLQRMVRIEGSVEKVDEVEAAKYFYARPVQQQIGILASDSKSVIKEEFGDGFNPVPKPDYAGGYRLVPSLVEFHQGYKEKGTWERFRFSKCGDSESDKLGPDGWRLERISP